MTKKKALIVRATKASAAREITLLFHQLSALIHTIRCIAQHEDQLCVLMHEAKNAASLDAGMRVELRELLDKIPAHEYMGDLYAVREAAASPHVLSGKRSRTSKKTAKQARTSRQR